jgi:hypothetical protein
VNNSSIKIFDSISTTATTTTTTTTTSTTTTTTTTKEYESYLPNHDYINQLHSQLKSFTH